MDNVLVLVRHGQSEWNRKNLFTGWRDPDLTEQGVAEATKAGKLLRKRGLHFDIAYSSVLTRANRTLELILKELEQEDLETNRDQSLNERDYGALSGMNKDDAALRWGADKVLQWRRSYDVPPPGGESLKDTAARVLPYYKTQIWPDIRDGKNVIVTAHGNSIRSLIMYLEDMSPQQVVACEVATGAPIIYRLTLHGHVADRLDLKVA